MQSKRDCIVVIGTGGTIAGSAADPSDELGYTAAQIGVDSLVAGLDGSTGSPVAGNARIETEQVAQIDSKDMSWDVWRSLAAAVARHLARPKVAGIVVTHGTDTLEETAWFLQRVLAPDRPVVITAAMRPATSPRADGPRNLADALKLARHPGARGVLVTLAGVVHGALDVRKIHTQHFDAFSSGDAGPIAEFAHSHEPPVAGASAPTPTSGASLVGGPGPDPTAESLRRHRPWPSGRALGPACLPADPSAWPWVEIVHNHAGANGAAVRALCAAGVQGIVVAATGNGTLHHLLAEALQDAARAGVPVWRSSRCLNGGVHDAEPVSDLARSMPSTGTSTPSQARVEMILQLLATGAVAAP